MKSEKTFSRILIETILFVETAMGQNINAQEDSDSAYVKAVYE